MNFDTNTRSTHVTYSRQKNHCECLDINKGSRLKAFVQERIQKRMAPYILGSLGPALCVTIFLLAQNQLVYSSLQKGLATLASRISTWSETKLAD